VVLLDPATVADRSTWEDPTALATGINEVWVNGTTVWKDGRVTGAYPGKGIRRP
jgi:N-acyl-D-amino-acid deacylase